MGVLNNNFSMLYPGVAIAVCFKPDYAIYNSKTATIILLFMMITLFKLTYQLLLYPAFLTPIKEIPTPSNRHWLTGNSESIFLESPFPQMREWIKAMPDEPLIRYYIVGNLERILPTSTKALSELLVTKVYDFEKPLTVRQSLRRVVGDGILLAEGEEHKIQRKNLLPAFAFRHIKDLYPVFWAKSVEMITVIQEDLESRKSPDDNTIQVRNWASRATLDIIGVAGMDHDFDSLSNPSNKLNQSYQKIFTSPSLLTKLLFLLGMLLGNISVIQKLPTQRNKNLTEGSQVIRDVARQMIQQKKSKMKDPNAMTGVDIISVAIQNGVFDEENLVDQLMTFLGAGHETTASAMQWAVYALSKNPDIQKRLREEIRANLPSPADDNSGPMYAATIDQLPYLHAVCNEILRFHPSVPATIRTAVRDTTLAGKPIPKGTFLILAPEVINKLKSLWGPDADKFNPDRFMGEGKANTGGATNNYAFLTFLHGPRSCIGQGFAKAELACLLAATVGRFHMELKYPDQKLEVREGATVAPKDGVLAKFTPLPGW
ncbi:Cytochrome monooxygenase FUM15 [Penicillium macrosclerotiorum]|uniref:Cytochrome monooxygenase FUM15 n=1 Tax=Penicillium macrosclerotiorum TaxID=303699 RepID=UPI00254714D3|nr:Cytochrome monooxygenase FUM15 [Penicillium macrosclerotiorum]KAJ5669721.1 Cytochrome monooxygenase FUM15 [Penicillium macrosclerotiorum]